MVAALLTNQAVFDDISLVKIEAGCMLALFLHIYCLPPPPRFNLENKAQLPFFDS